MTRPKTISDEEILAVARKVFRLRGHAASTREIGQEAGISEGVLYQRFGSKDDLFFAAMVPSAPDIEVLLGPEPPDGEALSYVIGVMVRLANYFGEVIPVALHVMTHPSFDHAALGKAMASTARLQEGLVKRLLSFESKKQMRKSTAEQTARIIVSLAHDFALSGALRTAAQRASEIEAMAAIIWNGIAPPERATSPRR